MGYIATPEEKAHRQAVINDIITPQETGSPMRGMLIKHMQRLVSDNNGRLHAKLHYLDTGEVLRGDILEFTQLVMRNNKAHVLQVKRMLAWHELFLRDLTVLSDAELLVAYGDLVLALRERRLPDPLPA